MKKKVFILFALVIILLLFDFYTYNRTNINNEIKVSNIYLEDEKVDITYYENKYDIYNDEITCLKMEESYYEGNNKIGNTSISDNLSIHFYVTVDKCNFCFDYSYIIKQGENILLENNLDIILIEYENEYYLISNENKIIRVEDILNESKIEKCAFYLARPDEFFGLNNRIITGGSGGAGGVTVSSAFQTIGIGLGTVAVIGIMQGAHSNTTPESGVVFSGGSSSSSGNSSKNVSTVSTVLPENLIRAIFNSNDTSFDDFFNREDVKNKLGINTVDDAKRVLCIMLGITSLSELENGSRDRVLCIGRDIYSTHSDLSCIDGYQNYANKYNYWAFYNSDYSSLIETYHDLMYIANELLVVYCCKNDWDFILVTNPYHYMEEHYTGKYQGLAYSREIKIIRSTGYNNFINVDYTWQTIPNPGLSEASHYQYAGYRISR